jgi:hypothetical protein
MFGNYEYGLEMGDVQLSLRMSLHIYAKQEGKRALENLDLEPFSFVKTLFPTRAPSSSLPNLLEALPIWYAIHCSCVFDMMSRHRSYKRKGRPLCLWTQYHSGIRCS